MSNVNIMRDGEVVSVPSESVVILAYNPVYTRISKYDLQARLTDDELDLMQAELSMASTRLNFIWGAIMYVDNTDPNYQMLRDVFVDKLGAARADEVLQPKE